MSELATKYDIPADLVEFFANPPLLRNESLEQYKKLRNGVIETVEPTNTCEWLLVNDLVNLSWEIRRSAKTKAALVNVMWKQAICMILEAHADGSPTERQRGGRDFACKYFTKDGRADTLEFLAGFGLDEDAIAAQAATLRLPELEIIDRQMERARVSRMAIARDIQHHRDARTWKRPADMLAIVDAKVVSIEGPAESARLAL